MLIIRTIVSLGLMGLAYYVGKQIGRGETIRQELDTWRQEPLENKQKAQDITTSDS